MRECDVYLLNTKLPTSPFLRCSPLACWVACLHCSPIWTCDSIRFDSFIHNPHISFLLFYYFFFCIRIWFEHMFTEEIFCFSSEFPIFFRDIFSFVFFSAKRRKRKTTILECCLLFVFESNVFGNHEGASGQFLSHETKKKTDEWRVCVCVAVRMI